MGRELRRHHCLTFSRFSAYNVDVTSRLATMSSKFAITSVYTTTATTMHAMAKPTSYKDDGATSPYPTVVIVAQPQYSAFT